MEGYFRLQRSISSVNPETILTIFGYPIANTTLMLFLVIVLIVFIAILLKKKMSLLPGNFQNSVEFFYEGTLGLVKQITGSMDRAEKIFPLIGALFVFVGISNLLGLIPGIASITYEGKSIFRTATSDFNTTFSLALGMVLFVQVISIKESGVFGYLGKFFQFHEIIKGFKNGVGAGFMGIMNFVIGLMDIISEIAKVVSLSLRLFGNMFAGEVLTTVILGGFTLILPALWMSMNLLAAVVQTIVFALLVTTYYTLALKPEKADKDD